MTTKFRIAALALIALAAGGCASAGGAESSSTTAAASATTPAPGETPTTTVDSGTDALPEVGASEGSGTDTTDSATSSSETADGATVTISGGFETDQRDGGRPVVLVASLLGVPSETFREAFSGVHPAKDGGPTGEEAQANKAALMSVLAPLGITNDALDTAANSYRYMASAGETWAHEDATATATVVDGEVTGITIDNPGRGYTSAPTITVTGLPGGIVTATATVDYTQDFATNGGISSITLDA